jgi:dienelactone hydrolase
MTRRVAGRRSTLILSLFALAAPSDAQIYDHEPDPAPKDTYAMARFRIYVPAGTEVVRGVYFELDPVYHDSRNVVYDPAYRQMCEDSGFALMGAILSDMHMRTGSGDAVLRALAAFADASGHEELEFAGIFLNGWSWGGQFAYHFAKGYPHRTLGFITQKGGLHDARNYAGDAIHVPGYLVIGQYDEWLNRMNLTSIFKGHRPLGALWALVVQPIKAHARVTDRELLGGFFEDVIALRVPETIPTGGPYELRKIEEAEGWLGSRDPASPFVIGAFDCYGGRLDEANWFPSRRVAEQWQAFVSGGTVTGAVACGGDPLATSIGPQSWGRVKTLGQEQLWRARLGSVLRARSR